MVALPLPPNMASLSASDDISKKIRKPYTITKSRESWTEQEHDKFLEALQLFDRDWKKIEAFVGSKSVIQIRSHAQKYFLKVQKNGSGEHVPPPRPKRKAAQPYPQKATKPAPIMPQVSAVTTPVASQTGPAYVYGPQPCTVFVPPVSSSPTVSGWVHHTDPPGNVPSMTKGIPVCTDFGAVSMMPGRDCSASSGASSSASWQQKLSSTGQGNQEACLRATPDFAGVYSFIGSVFDPSETGQLKKMKEMAPIDLEAVLLMMRNLSINLSSPDFEEHKRFLSVYDMGSIETMPGVGIGAEDQGIGDDMSVSDQPGSTQLTESADADSHSEPQMQMPFLQSHAQDAAELPRQCQLPYDGGGDITAVAKVSKVFGDVSSSPQVENKPSINLQHKSRRMQQGIILPARSEASELGVQSGSYRAVEGGNIDMWWP